MTHDENGNAAGTASKQERDRRRAEDFEWYKRELPRLYEEYGPCHLLISGKRVVAAFESFGDAVDEGLGTLGGGNFIVQECGPDESAYTMTVVTPWFVP